MNQTVSQFIRWLQNAPAPTSTPGLISLAPETKPSLPYKSCRCCGKGGMAWAQYEGKWRLFEGDTIHICPVNPLVLESGLSLSETT